MTQFLDKSGLEYYTTKVKQGLDGKVDSTNNPLVIYGNDENGNPTGYKSGHNFSFDNPILPEGYIEVEYIQNVVADVEVEEVVLDSSATFVINDMVSIANKFQEATNELGFTVEIFRIVSKSHSIGQYDVFGETLDESMSELFTSGSANQLSEAFGFTFSNNHPQSSDLIVLKFQSPQGNQYIDTGVVFCDEYYYDEESSLNVQGVNVDISGLKPYYMTMQNGNTYNYIDFVFYNDGSNDVVGRVPEGNLYPTNVSSLQFLEDSYGIIVTGDIIYGSSVETRDGTVIRISRTPYSGIIETEFRADEDTNKFFYPVTAQSVTGNFGTGIHTGTGGLSYNSWATSSFYSAMPVTNVWTSAYLSINNEKFIQFNVGENSTSASVSNCFFQKPLTIFANNREDEYGGRVYSAQMSIKRVKITKNTELSYYGVPCIRTSDEAVGMYDLVSETFQASNSDVPFIAGNPVVYPAVNVSKDKIDNSETTSITYAYNDEEYEQLTWLQSKNGNCVIDLGITPVHSYSYEIKFKVDGADNTVRGLYGNCSNNAAAHPVCSLRVCGYAPSTVMSLAWNNSSVGTTNDIAQCDFKWHTYMVTPSQVIMDGSAQFMHSSSSYSNTAKMALFGIYSGMGSYDSWTIEPQFKGKIEYFIVYGRNNSYQDVMIHHYIMVRRKSDGALGALDTIEGIFHPNLGSEDFIAGEPFEVKIEALPASNVFTTVSSSSSSGNTIDANIQPYSKLAGTHNTAYGVDTRINYGGENTLVGYKAENGTGANQGSSTVVGSQSTDSYGFGTVIGAKSTSSQNAGTVVGSSSSATATGAIAIGHNTKASGDHGINIGNFKANQGNRYSTAYHTISVGYGNQPSQTYGVAVGDEVTLGGNYAIGIGYQARPGQQATSIGYSTLAGMQSTAIGYNAKANEQNAVAIGNASARMDSICIASGSLSSNSQKGSVCIGRNANAWNYGVTIGYNGTNQNGDNSVVIGNSAVSQGGSNVAIGDHAQADLNNTGNPIAYGIAIGFNAVAKRHGAIQIGQGTNEEDGTLNIGLYSGKTGTSNNYKLLDFDGIIPYKRLSLTSPADKQAITYDAETDTVKWSTVEGGGGEPYTLPTATQRRLGGIKVGNGLSVKTDGTLSVDASATGGYGISYDGGFAESVYLISQTVDGGSADTKYTPAQVIDGGRANL